MDGSVMFGEVVGKIVGAGVPENVELSLDDSVADPMVAHVDVARFVLFGCCLQCVVCGLFVECFLLFAWVIVCWLCVCV